MSNITVTENHNLSIADLKKKIDIRKEQLLQEHYDKINNFNFNWILDTAIFSANVFYKISVFNFNYLVSGTIFLETSKITVLLESNVPETIFKTFKQTLEQKIHNQLNIIFNIPLPIAFTPMLMPLKLNPVQPAIGNAVRKFERKRRKD